MQQVERGCISSHLSRGPVKQGVRARNSNLTQRSTHPLVSLLIINYNGRSKLGALLCRCLESLLQTDYPSFELLFVDNASTDDSVTYVQQNFSDSRLKVISLDKNCGYACGANRGVTYAKGEIIGILNNDIIVDINWLRYLVEALLDGMTEGVRIAVPKILMLENPSKVLSCGGEMNALLVAWDRYILETDNDLGRRPMDRYPFHPAGAAFIVHRDLLVQLGNIFDDDYFAFFEDVDLGWSAQLLSYKVILVPNSIVYHKWGGSWGRASPSKFYFMRRNALYTGIKNLETHAAIALLPIWLLSTLYASYLFFKATRDTDSSASDYMIQGIKVVIDVLKNLKQLWRKHVAVSSRRRVDSRDLPISNTLLTYRAKLGQEILVGFVNMVLECVGLGHWKVTALREYPTFKLLRGDDG